MKKVASFVFRTAILVAAVILGMFLYDYLFPKEFTAYMENPVYCCCEESNLGFISPDVTPTITLTATPTSFPSASTTATLPILPGYFPTTTPIPADNTPIPVFPTSTSVVNTSTSIPPTPIPPTEIPPMPTEEPEVVCKNPNAEKDGSAPDCDAGVGNEPTKPGR